MASADAEKGQLPAPCKVKVPLENVAFPANPTAPTSVSSHPAGSGCDVTVKTTELLSFMVGATETSIGPLVAPDGMVMIMDVALQ